MVFRKSRCTEGLTDVTVVCWHHSRPQTTVQLQRVLFVPPKMTFRPGLRRPSHRLTELSRSLLLMLLAVTDAYYL